MRRLPVVVLLATLLALAAPVAQASDVEDLKISPSNPVDEADYEGGALIFANPASGQQVSPTVCRTSQYCDTIDLDITVPEGYEEDFNLRITVNWAAGPDLDLFFWDGQERSQGNAASANNPEIISKAYWTPGRYYITVLQWDTPLVIYNVRAEFIVRQPILPRKKSTTTAVSSPSGSGSVGSAGRDPSFGQDFGGSFGGGVIPIGDPPPLEPIAIDIPDDESERVGFAPLDDDVELASSISFDGGRLSVGVLSLAVIALLSYFLFFIPRKDPIRKVEPAA